MLPVQHSPLLSAAVNAHQQVCLRSAAVNAHLASVKRFVVMIARSCASRADVDVSAGKHFIYLEVQKLCVIQISVDGCAGGGRPRPLHWQEPWAMDSEISGAIHKIDNIVIQSCR
jgi:hypothetical protein